MTCWYCDQPATEPSGLCTVCEREVKVRTREAHELGLKTHHVDTCSNPECRARTVHQSVVKCAPSEHRLCGACMAAQAGLEGPAFPEPDWSNRGFKREKRRAVVVWGHRRKIRGKGWD